MGKKEALSQESARLGLLQGHHFEASVKQPNTVRVFLSSTFHDFVEERNHLFNQCLPQLESWCEERGLEFSFVDMRWGIRDSQAADHKSAAMCLREVDKCQESSVGPNFVALLGDRYGYRNIPSKLPLVHFERFKKTMDVLGLKEGLEALKTWYWKDDNAQPPEFFLQPLTQVLPDLEKEEQKRRWKEAEDVLREAFIGSLAKINAEFGEQEHHEYSNYLTSITAQEVHAGILRVEHPEQHSLCFCRNMSGISLKPDSKAARYVDYNKETMAMDETAQKLLGELKNFTVPLTLDNASIFNFSIPFDPTRGVNPNIPKHRQYLDKFGQLFVSRMRGLIEEGLKNAEKSNSDGTFMEVSRHASFLLTKAELYCGHEEILESIFQRLSTNAELHQPFVLYGESGAGKTATIARLIQEAPAQLEKVPNIVYRFLGTTPASSNLDTLFLSLSRQIAELYGLRTPEFEQDFNELKPFFFELLEEVGTQQQKPPLLIILDSLDQLSSNFGAHLMNWLPQELPTHVTILLSVMPNYEKILERLQARLQPQFFFELPQFTADKAAAVFASLLENQGRTLTRKQMELGRLSLSQSPTPLLIHLNVLEARRWSSFATDQRLRLGRSAKQAVGILFDRLERDHGTLLVTHALSYIVVSKNGLTEKEMQEVLSLDDAVLNDVYQYWPPPSDLELQVPPPVWARLRQDMAEFIMNRQADGKTVIGIYHKQFVEVIHSRYLSNEATKQAVLHNLIDYFGGKWAGKTKPIHLDIIKTAETKPLFRKVRPQPLRFGAKEGRFNLRKFAELPYLLTSAREFDRVKSECLLDFEWIQAKTEACGIGQLMEDFAFYQAEIKALGLGEDQPVAIIQKTLRMSRPTLEYPDAEDILATEIIGRCSNLMDEVSEIKLVVRSAIEWCKQKAEKSLLLIPLNQTFTKPNGALLTTLSAHMSGITSMVSNEDNSILVTGGKDWTLRIWDLHNDSITHIIELRAYPEALAIHNASETFFVVESKGDFSRYDLKSGTLIQKYSLEQLYKEFNPTSSEEHKDEEGKGEKLATEEKVHREVERRKSLKSAINLNDIERIKDETRQKSSHSRARTPSNKHERNSGKESLRNGTSSRGNQFQNGERYRRNSDHLRMQSGKSSSKSRQDSISPEKKYRGFNVKAGRFEGLEEFGNLTENTHAVCKVYHSSLLIFWGGHVFLFDLKKDLKLVSILSPGASICNTFQYHELFILTLNSNKLCYLDLKAIQGSVVTFENSELPNDYEVVGTGFRPKHSLAVVANTSKGVQLVLFQNLEIGLAFTPEAVFRVFPIPISDGPATKTAFDKDTIAVAGKKRLALVEISNEGDVGSTELITLEQDICALELASLSKAHLLLLVGCADESVRVYDGKSGLQTNYLSGLWGRPEVIYTNKATLFTGTGTAQFIKVWNLASEEDADIPNHIKSFRYSRFKSEKQWHPSRVTPMCTWSEEENSFLAVSTDVDGRMIVVANSSGIVDEISLPQQNPPVDGLLLITKRNELVYGSESGSVYMMKYEPLQPDPLRSLKTIAELRNRIRSYHYSAELAAALLLLDTDRIVKLSFREDGPVEFAEVPVHTDIVPEHKTLPAIQVLSASMNQQRFQEQKLGEPRLLSAVALTEYGVALLRHGAGCLLQTEEGAVVRKFGFELAGSFAARGELLAVQTSTQLIQIANLKESAQPPVLIEFSSNSFPVTTLELSSDGGLLLAGTGSGSNLLTGQRQLRIFNAKDGSVARRKVYMYSPVLGLSCLGKDLVAVCLSVGYFALFTLRLPLSSPASDQAQRTVYNPNLGRMELAGGRQHQKRSAACLIL